MPSVKEPDLALAGLAILVIFGLLIWYDRPIESARPFDPYAQHQNLQATGYAYETWLWQDPFGFDSISQKKESEFYSVNQKKEFAFYFINQKEKRQGQCKHQLDNKIKNIKKGKKNVKILAPLLKVRSDTIDIENKELRTRDRYAVIAGLIESGYRPGEPDHLHFCSTQENKEYDVRWEHFRYKPLDASGKNETNQPNKDELDNKPDILVVWMNSEIFTHPDKFDAVSKSLFRSKKIDNFYIFDLNNILDHKQTADITKEISHINKNYKKKIELKRIGDDDKALAKKLTKELGLRNITEPSEIIIITEQDSENVRSFARNFRESLCASFPKPRNANAETSDCEIKNVFYIKGLDAYQQVLHKQDKNEDQANKSTARLSVIDLDIPPPLPIGPSQFDYFHRLAEQISNPHKEINLEKRDNGIKAVGIFGIDFYDKLLILEALRAKMPNILVFTTGLDAQMLHPQHWLSTRNLVVASHFDLLLNDEYQKQFPPFRDSQQTNIFYRAIGIANDDVEKYEITSPQIFEIGRNGPVRLPQEKNEDLKYHPRDNTLKQEKIRLGLLWAIVFFLVWFHSRIRPNAKISSVSLMLSSLVILLIALVFATSESGEPLSYTDGTSLWPTIFIQIIAILLASAFFYIARRDLDKNFRELNVHPPFFKIDLKESSFFKPPAEFAWAKLFLPGIILISTAIAYAINDAYPSSFLWFWPCLIALVFLAIFFLFKIRTKKGPDNLNFDSIKDWIEKDNRKVKTSTKGANSLWQEYYEYAQVDHSVNRAVAIWLFFAIIETILIYLLPPWPWPCRGPTCDWVYWTGVTSFVVIMILLFFILDTVKLSYFWIKKLRKRHPLLEDPSNAFDNPFKSLEKIVEVVAKRTRAVDKLIYFPMLCIMLMLFAKITYFDNQDFPLSKAITFAASISLLFFSGFMLRYEAKRLKLSVIERLKELSKTNKSYRIKADATIERINGICEGAFEPMFEQPVMRALLIILASLGLFAGEYLKLFE